MNFFENEYALPVILGGTKEAISVANLLRGNTDASIHIFAQKLSFINRLIYNYHEITSVNDDILLIALNDFVDNIHEYYTPILIFCDDEGKCFTEKYFDILEQRYIIISSTTTKNYFAQGEIFNEDQ